MSCWSGFVGKKTGFVSLAVVILSSSPLDTDMAATKALDVIDYWVKPSDPRKLEEMVASLKNIIASVRPS